MIQAFVIIFKVNGGWVGWSNWSACAVTCGNGNQTRSRSCDDPTPSAVGNDCDGESIELRTCTAEDCEQNGDTLQKREERGGYIVTKLDMQIKCFVLL